MYLFLQKEFKTHSAANYFHFKKPNKITQALSLYSLGCRGVAYSSQMLNKTRVYVSPPPKILPSEFIFGKLTQYRCVKFTKSTTATLHYFIKPAVNTFLVMHSKHKYTLKINLTCKINLKCK